MDETIVRLLRNQAWERAKGELQAVLVTFVHGTRREGQFDEMNAAVNKFVKIVEDHGLAE